MVEFHVAGNADASRVRRGPAASAARRTIFLMRPPKVAGICDEDGGKLVQRGDDRPEVVKERFAAYERQTMPLADYYRRHGVLEVVDGAPASKK